MVAKGGKSERKMMERCEGRSKEVDNGRAKKSRPAAQLRLQSRHYDVT